MLLKSIARLLLARKKPSGGAVLISGVFLCGSLRHGYFNAEVAEVRREPQSLCKLWIAVFVQRALLFAAS